MRRIALTVGVSLALVTFGCGKKSKGGGGGGAATGKVEDAFLTAASDTDIPVRYMMAVGFLESRLAPQNATSNYVSIGHEDEPVARGTLLTQTAFGLTFEQLGLDPAKDQSQLLETQINAYAKWLRSQIDGAELALTDDPALPEDQFDWIRNLALLHRQGLEQRRNVQIVFAKELIQILNEGFVWQDPRNGEQLIFDKENPKIDITDDEFPKNGRNWLALGDLPDAAEIYTATYLPLATVPTSELVNLPKRVEVIHCPLTLSACLELQTRNEESDVRLAAHYMIPQLNAENRSVVNRVLQVAKHKEVVILTNSKGEDVPVQNAVVIMLVGNSGRSVSGARSPAIPTWFTDRQLRAMAQVVNDVCTLLSQRKVEPVDRDECMSTSGPQGVQFRHQGESEEYRWGDIADFDSTIFDAYIKNPSGLSTEVAFEFDGDERRFEAGDEIPLTVLFDTSARTVELERLNRCPSGKVVWEPVRIDQVRAEKSVTFDEIYHDSGPNRNGDQFFRARIYAKDGRLTGWSIDQIYLEGFEPDPAFASEKYCGD